MKSKFSFGVRGLYLGGALLALSSAAACTKSEPAPPAATAVAPVAAEPPADAQQAAPSVEAASPAITKQLSFVPSKLTSTDDEGVVDYCLNCRVQAARYDHCHFEVEALHAAVGDENLDVEVNVEVEMLAKANETYRPEDPNAPQPEGGFKINTYRCRVLQVLSAP